MRFTHLFIYDEFTYQLFTTQFHISVFDNHDIDNLNYPLDTLHQLKYLDMSNCSIDALPNAIFAANVALEELR